MQRLAVCVAFAALPACTGPEHRVPNGVAGSFASGAGAAPASSGAGGQDSGDSMDGGTMPTDAAVEREPTLEDAGASDAGDAQPSLAGGPGTPDGGSTMDAGPSDAGAAAEAAWTCDGDYAFGAASTLVFADPTPPALASALASIDAATHPISLVLHLQDDALIGALSGTTQAVNGKEIFLPNHAPALAPVVAAFGSPPGVTSSNPQSTALLHFADNAGPVDILIQHIVWRATEGSTCAEMSVSFQAVVPSSQFSIVLHLSDGDQSIGELIDASGSSPGPTPIGGPTPSPIPIEIAATFQGLPLDFDFDTL